MSRISFRGLAQLVDEVMRYLLGWILAILMLVPALVITIADRITMARLRRRGGRD